MTLEEIAALIKDVPDFPKPGIIFKDITPLLADAKALDASVEYMVHGALNLAADAVLAIESRGFIFGGMLAHRLGLPLQLVRKRGKLPRASVSIRYELEYGFDHLEMHTDAVQPGQRCLIVDDLMATGGTANAVAKLVELEGGVVAGCLFLIELGFLNGRDQLGERPVVSLIRY
jgi:adenine phosphoribosyltransferase